MMPVLLAVGWALPACRWKLAPALALTTGIRGVITRYAEYVARRSGHLT